MNALDGVKVLDLSHVIAGPTASHYLALEGAQVIKLEHPGKGDVLRGGTSDLLDERVPIGFAAINGGKRSLAMDLKQPRAKVLLSRLIETSDVFIENFRPGAVARLGFDYDAVKALKPDIVYASISGFGQEGRWAPRAAYDHVVQSAIGMTMLQGSEGQDPIKVGFPVIDTATGMLAAQAILAALFRRLRLGLGAYLDISMCQSGLQLMWPEVARVLLNGQDAPRVGNRGFSGSPGAATFRCADGWISSAANTMAQFRALCQALDLPQLPDDAELIDQDRLRQGGFLVAKDPTRVFEQLALAMSTRQVDVLEAQLAKADVPCARLRLLGELVASATQGDLMTLPVRKTRYPLGVMTDFGAGYKADRQVGQALPPAPRLGQHTAEILTSLGVTGTELEQLAAAGTIRR
jgi:crotonobetainyl-CoA:carnitine CoA-transferase CaiB-like acyl-CoA transferase